MKLLEAEFMACFACCLVPGALSAAPIGATSRSSVQIVASIAPRVQITGARADDALCVNANAPAESFSVTAADESGADLGTIAIAPASSCQGSRKLDEKNLLEIASLRSRARASGPGQLTLLITPQ